MEGKLIAVAYILCIHSQTISFWTEFVNKNRCNSDPRRIKAFNFDNFENSNNNFP